VRRCPGCGARRRYLVVKCFGTASGKNFDDRPAARDSQLEPVRKTNLSCSHTLRSRLSPVSGRPWRFAFPALLCWWGWPSPRPRAEAAASLLGTNGYAVVNYSVSADTFVNVNLLVTHFNGGSRRGRFGRARLRDLPGVQTLAHRLRGRRGRQHLGEFHRHPASPAGSLSILTNINPRFHRQHHVAAQTPPRVSKTGEPALGAQFCNTGGGSVTADSSRLVFNRVST